MSQERGEVGATDASERESGNWSKLAGCPLSATPYSRIAWLRAISREASRCSDRREVHHLHLRFRREAPLVYDRRLVEAEKES